MNAKWKIYNKIIVKRQNIMTVKTPYHTLNILPLVATDDGQFDSVDYISSFPIHKPRQWTNRFIRTFFFFFLQAVAKLIAIAGRFSTPWRLSILCDCFIFAHWIKRYLVPSRTKTTGISLTFVNLLFLVNFIIDVYCVQCTMFIRLKLTLDTVFCYWPFFRLLSFKVCASNYSRVGNKHKIRIFFEWQRRK